MAKVKFKLPWRRFWCPLGSKIFCEGDDIGFLIDPTDEFGRYANFGLHSLAEMLLETGALTLCGEPGIGKSTELEAMRTVIEADHASNGGGLCWLNFQEIADFTDFRRRTVESIAWQQWRQGQGRFTLVVDGVDEGMLRVTNFVNLLSGLLGDEPKDRLRLILACRTREWPIASGEALLGMWPGNPAECVYELCPLRRADVVIAAESRGLHASGFLEAVSGRRVTALANRPITLFFLLDEFAQHSALPQSHRELYQRAIERLSGEVNPQRLETLRSLRRASPAATAADRLRAAQRLACLLLVSGGTGVRVTTVAGSPAVASDLPVDAALDEGAGNVSAQALDEALETPLFTSLGPHRFGFIHRTITECLAAEHLRALPLVQLRRLLCQRDEDGEHVIPQLAELAAWVAGSHPSFGEHVLRIEPEVLLRSDVIHHRPDFKARLVAAVLQEARRERLHDGKRFDDFLSGLAHPGLEAQLGPVISNPHGHRVERRIAMSIARDCCCSGLTDYLLARVLDANEDNHLRERAADALAAAVPDDQIHLLEPLARGEIQPDTDDSIKADALHRLVPRFWKVRDALPHLTHRKNDHFIGSYWAFLDHVLPDRLEDKDIVPVLEWLRLREHCLDSQSTFHRLAAVALTRALKRLHEPAVAAMVVRLWQLWSNAGLRGLPSDNEIVVTLQNDESLRRHLAALYLNDPATELTRYFAVFCPLALLSYEPVCLDWLLDQIAEVLPDRRPVWAVTVQHLAMDAAIAAPCWDKLFQRMDEVPALAERLAWLTRVWNLDEPEAHQMRDRHLSEQQSAAHLAERLARDRTAEAAAAIGAAFGQYDGGDHGAWLPLWLQLVGSEDGQPTHFSKTDLTTCPHWALLNARQQACIPQIARAYLLAPTRPVHALNEGRAPFWATRSALCLLRQHLANDPPLRERVLAAWLDHVVFTGGSDSDTQRDLFRCVYALGPDRVLAALDAKARAEAAVHRRPQVFYLAADVWDLRLSETVLSVVRDSTDPRYVLHALDELAGRDPDAALDHCAAVVSVPPPPPTASYSVALLGALTVGLLHDADRFWPVAATYFQTDDALARAVLERVSYEMDLDRRQPPRPVSVETLGWLFEQIRRCFPATDDPPEHPDGVLTARDAVRGLRNRLPGMIAARASREACRELLRLVNVSSSDEAAWLRRTYRDALTSTRRNRWRAPRAEDVKQILGRAQARLLVSDDDLLELVLESLERLEIKLKRQSLPRAEDLWSWEGGGNRRTRFSHKDEEAISDYVANWFWEDLGPTAGIVVGREVQPRRGSHTDITIQATVRNEGAEFDTLTVVIEVKGCWHPEVLTALQGQLAEGYLKEQGTRCGVYLVGWFKCPQWPNDDTRLRSTTLADAKKEVADLAAGFDGTASPYKIGGYLLDCTLPPVQSPSSRAHG